MASVVTPEQIVVRALNRLPGRKARYHEGSADVVNVVQDLRAAGLLGGDPQEPSGCQHNMASYTDSATMKPEHFCTLCGYEPALSPDREKLKSELRRGAHDAALAHDSKLSDLLWRAANALAAPLTVDEEKLAEVIPAPRVSRYVAEWPEDEQDFYRNGDWNSFEDREKTLDLMRRRKVARAVVEGLTNES